MTELRSWGAALLAVVPPAMARTEGLGGLPGLSGLAVAGFRGCALQQKAEAHSADMLTTISAAQDFAQSTLALHHAAPCISAGQDSPGRCWRVRLGWLLVSTSSLAITHLQEALLLAPVLTPAAEEQYQCDRCNQQDSAYHCYHSSHDDRHPTVSGPCKRDKKLLSSVS